MGLFVYDSFRPMVKIGSYCDFAANISLIAESATCMSELSKSDFVKEHYIKTGSIIIEDNCWIGANVIVLPGIIIGHHSIIGAGSIVTKNIPPHSVVKGQPGIVTKNIEGLL
jgi:acetyltransferase-like isoleucine patch superfamily enzyme